MADSFPTDENLLQAWLCVIPVEGSTRFKKVCSNHFKSQDFLNQGTRKRLTMTAVPSVLISTAHSPVVKTEKLEFEEEQSCEEDSPSADSGPVLSADRNKDSKQLLITIDARVLKSPPEDHNYTLKCEPPEISPEPSTLHEDTMTDSDSQDDEATEAQPSAHITNDSSSQTILGGYLNRMDIEHYDRIRIIKESNRRKHRIEQLQRKVKSLQSRLRRSNESREQMKILSTSVKKYTRFSEIDNILSGRFKELCKTVTSNTPKKLDYTADVIKFAMSLYHLSPKAYNFVKEHMDLPHTNILDKYLATGTYIKILKKNNVKCIY